MGVAVGVDLGGTKIRMALVADEGRILSDAVFPTGDAHHVEEVVKTLGKEIRKILGEAGASLKEIRGVGIGCAGQISQDGRVVLFSPNLKWRDVHLADHLEAILERHVSVENDVRTAALGEARFGAGKGIGDLICIFVGTGVGSGILIGGRLLRGARNLAGEVGHTKLDPDGPQCTCGGRGCLEVYAGGGHIRRRVMEAIQGGEKSPLADVREIHVDAVKEAARRGDPLAKRFWDELVWALSLSICNLITVFNPKRVILGGGVVEGSPILLKHVKDAVPGWVTMLSGKHVEIVRAQLGPRAGAIGASQLFEGGLMDIVGSVVEE